MVANYKAEGPDSCHFICLEHPKLLVKERATSDISR